MLFTANMFLIIVLHNCGDRMDSGWKGILIVIRVVELLGINAANYLRKWENEDIWYTEMTTNNTSHTHHHHRHRRHILYMVVAVVAVFCISYMLQ